MQKTALDNEPTNMCKLKHFNRSVHTRLISLPLTFVLLSILGTQVQAQTLGDYSRNATPTQKTLVLGGGVKLELVLIPAGKFMMGSPPGEKQRFSEWPQHEVRITRPFYMGKYPVTNEQTKAVMDKIDGHPFFAGMNNPVYAFSWNDAQDFCKKLSVMTGKTVRLPTEAEWEYACRAGTTTRYFSGDSDTSLTDVAWFRDNSNRTHPVGQKKPNAWGLYDMCGNVAQWCQDYWARYEPGAAVDPHGPEVGETRVLRGCCFFQAADDCRSAARGNNLQGCNMGGTGFRIVMETNSMP